MKYKYYTICYTSASNTRVFTKTFEDIKEALNFVQNEYGYELLEPYFEITGWGTICTIKLKELFDNNLIGALIIMAVADITNI
jgi:hypothetical protein